jgi:SRSO17 transposase
LEVFAENFDELFAQRSQRESFRRYLEGLLLPMERNKTLTGLANTEPIEGAQHTDAQKLQWFLSESTWDPAAINQRRLEIWRDNKVTCATGKGILAIDETGDRKWGSKTAHVGRQYLSNVGKVDNGIVSVETVWADERLYYPLEVEPYTPQHWFEGGQQNPAFRTKPEIALELVKRAVENNLPFRAVVADSAYGENETLRVGLRKLEVGYVMALHRSHTWWHKEGAPGSARELAQGAAWQPDDPGDWQSITRRFRDGHEETWWALETTEGPYGPDQGERLVIVTTDPTTLPDLTTWYLITNLPAPRSKRAKQTALPPADLTEIVRLYGLRIWIEQTYKQVKQHLGWAQYQVRSDLAIRRHWQLVCCAFSFCWWALDRTPLGVEQAQPPNVVQPAEREGEKKSFDTDRLSQLARRPTPSAGLAHPVSVASTLLACLVRQATSAPASAAA